MATATSAIETERSERLADIHIAEYNALTSRITYFVTMQYVVWGIAAGLFGYLAPLWWTGHSHQNLEWIGLLCLLAVTWAVLHINYEFLAIVQYLKEQLLPNMGVPVADLDEALGFERWIRTLGMENLHRDQATSLPFLVGFVALVVLLWRDFSYAKWSSSDTWWAVLSGSLVVVIFVKVWRLEALKKRLNRASPAPKTEETGS